MARGGSTNPATENGRCWRGQVDNVNTSALRAWGLHERAKKSGSGGREREGEVKGRLGHGRRAGGACMLPKEEEEEEEEKEEERDTHRKTAREREDPCTLASEPTSSMLSA